MKREDRLQQIKEILAGYSYALTVGEVAKAMGLKRSKYVVDMLLELEAVNAINMEWTEHYQFGRTRVFWVTMGTWAEQNYEYGEIEAFHAEQNRPEEF